MEPVRWSPAAEDQLAVVAELGNAALATEDVVGISSAWWDQWKDFARGSSSAWPGPVGPCPPLVYLYKSVVDKLVEMNAVLPRPGEQLPGEQLPGEQLPSEHLLSGGLALAPRHWTDLRWSSASGACTCCGMRPARLSCTLGYCSEACHASHYDYHQCEGIGPTDADLAATSSLTRRKKPVGLRNLGNTCFLNAPVQCLMHAKPLTRYFLGGSHLKDAAAPSAARLAGSSPSVSAVWAQLCRAMWFGSDASISPAAVKRFAAGKTQFSGFEQQDCHEFLTFMLEALHEDLDLARARPAALGNLAAGEGDSAADAWLRLRLRERSVITHLFHGLLASCVRCASCGFESNSHSEFRELVLKFETEDRILAVTVARQCPPAAPKLPPWALNTKYACLVHPGPASCGALRAQLAQMAKVPPERLWLCSLWRSRPVRHVEDAEDVSGLADHDELVAFEFVPGACNLLVSHRCSGGAFQGLPTLVVVKPAPGRPGAVQQARALLGARLEASLGRADFAVPVEQLRLLVGERALADEDLLAAGGLVHCVCEWDKVPGEFDLQATARSREHASMAARGRPGERRQSVRGLLRTFCQPETLDGYKCDGCKAMGAATKTTLLKRLPEILIIQIARFANVNSGFDKVKALVEFDLEGFDLEEFSDDAASCVYDLVSVCNHFGQLGAGHYVSTVCLDVTDAAPGQEWVELDDALCVPIADKASVVSEAAYILFYRRRAEAG